MINYLQRRTRLPREWRARYTIIMTVASARLALVPQRELSIAVDFASVGSLQTGQDCFEQAHERIARFGG